MSRKLIISAAAVIAVLTAGAAAYVWWGARNSAPEYRFGKVERGAITSAVSATGTVNPVTVVQVGSQVSGQLKEIYVDFNSTVKKDQVIAQIDPDSFRLRVNQAAADVEGARATVLTQRANVSALNAEVSRARVGLADAEREFQRSKMLHEKNFVSAAALDKAEFAYRAAQEQLKVSQAQLAVGESQVRNVEAIVRQRESQLAQAKVDLDRTTIRAPVDGIVVEKAVEPGQTVAASLQAPKLFVIAQDLRRMQVDTSIDEAEVGRIREGQSATFTVDSFPGRTFRGTVGQVRRAALVVQNVVTYTAVVATSNPNLELFPGMTANVRIVVDTRENALKVPNAALRFRPAGAVDTRETGAAQEPGGAPSAEAESKKGGGGQAAAQAQRERLTKELQLTPEQQGKLDAILNETRDRMRALDTEDKGERRRQSDRLRAESRARIAEILNPEQRKRYEEMTPGRAGGGRTNTAGRVWVVDDRGKPKAVSVRIGLADGTYSELVGGALQEGAQVIVVTRELAKEYRMEGYAVQALRGVSLEIAAGEFVAVMGPSGSGKSTFMNLLGCLDSPTAGEYLLAGERVSELSGDALAATRNRRIGFVFQNFNLLARTSAVENVELPLLYSHCPAEARRQRAMTRLAQVGLAERALHQPSQLSGGQQQRVAIARALVNDPVLILADEPTGALDTRTSFELMGLLQQLNRGGMTVVLVTHEHDIATFASRIVSFRDGHVVSDERVAQPADALAMLRAMEKEAA